MDGWDMDGTTIRNTASDSLNSPCGSFCWLRLGPARHSSSPLAFSDSPFLMFSRDNGVVMLRVNKRADELVWERYLR
jgi:hypothetical protein